MDHKVLDNMTRPVAIIVMGNIRPPIVATTPELDDTEFKLLARYLLAKIVVRVAAKLNTAVIYICEYRLSSRLQW
jgi:hypothetical protein